MTHQLIPNTYTICESTEQCKELFSWAKANGIKVAGNVSQETILDWNENDENELVAWVLESTAKMGSTFIPLPEFISRLKGEWVEGISVTLTKYEADVMMRVFGNQDAEEWLANNNYNERCAVQRVFDKIQQQLNQRQA